MYMSLINQIEHKLINYKIVSLCYQMNEIGCTHSFIQHCLHVLHGPLTTY